MSKTGNITQQGHTWIMQGNKIPVLLTSAADWSGKLASDTLNVHSAKGHDTGTAVK